MNEQYLYTAISRKVVGKSARFIGRSCLQNRTKATYKTHRNVYLGFCHYIGYTRPYGKPGQDWTGLVSRVQSSFSIWSATHPCPFTRRTFFNTLHFWLGLLRWLDTVFQGQYLPSLSINYVAINKVLEKLPPQLY